MYLDTGNKAECYGCEACVQICTRQAISMKEDDEGFRYPMIQASSCVDCGMCRKVCPFDRLLEIHKNDKTVFGGYNKNPETRFESTSGGAFSAIVNAFCDDNYVIFGAEAKGLHVFHSSITDKRYLGKYRKSKYSQSVIGSSFFEAKKFLKEGKKVLFSGTPCQIAGLLSFLGETNRDKLLTVEVVCEGVPSPIYIQKLNKYIENKYGSPIQTIDYRYTGKSFFSHGKWDFQDMCLTLETPRKKEKYNEKKNAAHNKQKKLILDRWFNPFWYVWLNHLMSRPSCYHCKFATTGRVADITLGDLWGVHLYCPDLYGQNGGSSLVVCNTEKGRRVLHHAKKNMYGRELAFEDALKYQSPMRKTIAENPDRDSFMTDLKSDMDYKTLNKKWTGKPTLKLLYQKYIWGNRQKIFVWTLKQKLVGKKGNQNA